MNHKLSIIIPCYNCAKTLEEAVNSCYEQDLKDFEIIMVDDASTDNTPYLMKKISKEYNNIRLFFNKENKGGGETRNIAVRESKNDIIFCLDSDDILPEKTLSRMLKYLEEKKADGIAFHHSIKFRNTNKNDIQRIESAIYLEGPVPFESVFNDTNPLFVVFMYTKKSFEKIGGYPTHGFDTQGFGWRFLSSGLKAYICPNTKYLHRIEMKETYYLSEYNKGKVNYNLQKILLEHSPLFTKETLNFINDFPIDDFTRNILDELKLKNNILVKNYSILIEQNKSKIDLSKIQKKYKKTIARDSLRGIFLRIKFKIKSLLKSKLFVVKIYKYIYRILIKNKYIYFLSQTSKPISDYYGFDRGTPLDRYFIESFLDKNKDDIKDTVWNY